MFPDLSSLKAPSEQMVGFSHRRQWPLMQAPCPQPSKSRGRGVSESEIQRKPLLSAYYVLVTLRLEQKQRTKEACP